MPRGIQLGQNATDAAAALMDNQCKNISIKLFNLLKTKYGPDIVMQKKLDQKQIPGGEGACQPDGGVWFWKGTLIAAFEAKKQQNRGNAIERWYKNPYACRLINPDMSYVTFAVGQGAVRRGTIHKALAMSHLGGFDTYVPGKNSCFMKPLGFTAEEVEAIMLQVLEERITSQSV
jgi:hypothetical protein